MKKTKFETVVASRTAEVLQSHSQQLMFVGYEAHRGILTALSSRCVRALSELWMRAKRKRGLRERIHRR